MELEFSNHPDFSSKGDPNCREYDPELFFPDPEGPNFYYLLKEAKKVCTGCPYQLECLTYAVKNNDPGVWGGTSEGERAQMRRNRRIALPEPKKPKRW